jgi:hypothetical protein
MVRAWVSMTRACRLMLVGGAFESFGELGDVFLGGFVQAECGDDLRPGVPSLSQWRARIRQYGLRPLCSWSRVA